MRPGRLAETFDPTLDAVTTVTIRCLKFQMMPLWLRMTTVAVFTSSLQPKIIEDYSSLAASLSSKEVKSKEKRKLKTLHKRKQEETCWEGTCVLEAMFSRVSTRSLR